MSLLAGLAVAAGGLATAGMAQAGVGAAAVRRFHAAWRRPGVVRDGIWPAVTVLKPLSGDEPLLEEALASVCAQDYPGVQIVFGVQDAADPALATVARLRARFPGCDIAVVTDPRQHGPIARSPI